jgi:hypothetical protein
MENESFVKGTNAYGFSPADEGVPVPGQIDVTADFFKSNTPGMLSVNLCWTAKYSPANDMPDDGQRISVYSESVSEDSTFINLNSADNLVWAIREAVRRASIFREFMSHASLDQESPVTLTCFFWGEPPDSLSEYDEVEDAKINLYLQDILEKGWKDLPVYRFLKEALQENKFPTISIREVFQNENSA